MSGSIVAHFGFLLLLRINVASFCEFVILDMVGRAEMARRQTEDYGHRGPEETCLYYVHTSAGDSAMSSMRLRKAGGRGGGVLCLYIPKFYREDPKLLQE